MLFANPRASKGVPIVADESYPVNTLDFKPLMTKVKATNPDYFLMVAVATTVVRPDRMAGIR